MSDRVSFVCNGEPVALEVEPGESLLSVLRERIGLVSVKDGCAPQGQCGCCTVLVGDDPRVACVTPVTRVEGRAVTTVEGLAAAERAALAEGFFATGGSQCGFCTPGIVMRAAGMIRKRRTNRAELGRALAAHLCRCTGWRTVYDAIDAAVTPPRPRARDLDVAARRAELEGGAAQRVNPDVPLGAGGFADDGAPRGALVAVPLPPDSRAPAVDAAGLCWVVGESLLEARTRAGKVQGRRTTAEVRPPLPLPPLPPGGVRLATSWVEPAYLELDASWCEPGGEPASSLANGGAFGGKECSPAPAAARELARRLGRPVRVVFSREDTVRLGPKRPPVAASAVFADGRAQIAGVVARGGCPAFTAIDWPYAITVESSWAPVDLVGPPTASYLRAAGLAEQVALLEAALDEADVDRGALAADERAASVLLDVAARAPSGALAGARVTVDPEAGTLAGIEVRVAAGEPLDAVVLRSYATGAAHMALGWVCSEGLTVDAVTGEVQDLTIRSFGVIRAMDTPPVDVTVLDDSGPPLARASDAVFAAVAAATWNALSRAEGARPETWPARGTRAARALR